MDNPKPTRRSFLGTVAVAASIPFASNALTASAAKPLPASRYRFLDDHEAAFVEHLVNTICPADHLTPDGVTSGLAACLDRRLADGSSEPASAGQAQLFKAGVAAANEACYARHGVSFDRLTSADALAFLADIRAGAVAASIPLDSWSTEIVDPLLIEACYAGPVYGRYGSRMFFKLFDPAAAPATPIATL